MTPTRAPTVCQLTVSRVVERASRIRGEEFARDRRRREPEKVFDLRRCDQQSDAVGEADGDGAGNELHRWPRPVRPMTRAARPP